MLQIRLPPEFRDRLIAGLQDAGPREIGGILMAEHTGVNDFTVRDLTVHRRGTWSSFVRTLADALLGLRAFFNRTQCSYTRYNYLGEWHSHPSFSTQPSETDDASMRAIVGDLSVGATFVVLVILKLDIGGALAASAHTYLPDGSKHESQLIQEASP